MPVPVYSEVRKIGAEFAAAGAALASTAPHSRVAMLQSYESRWAIDFQRHNKHFDPVGEFAAFYRPLQLGAQSVDVIATDAPLQDYAGAWLDPTLMRKVADRLLSDSAVKPIIPGAPEEIEVCERNGAGKTIWIVINHARTPQTVHLPLPIKTVLVGHGPGDGLQLAAHDVAVVEVK
jgi:hypothetical protein